MYHITEQEVETQNNFR